MPIKTTAILDTSSGAISHADTVEYKGVPWLVGGWVAADAEGSIRPVRIIRPVAVDFQNGGQWGDYLLTMPISNAVLEGSEPAAEGQYEVIEFPDGIIESRPE